MGLHPIANVRRYIRAGLLVILAAFGGIGSWAVFAPLSGAVIAIGFVKVDTNRKTVQHLEGGIIKEILVRDGDRVEAGQTLMVLEDEKVSASVDLVDGQLNAELAKAARLQAELNGLETVEFSERLISRAGEAKVDDLVRNETNLFNARRTTLKDQAELLKHQISQAKEQIVALNQQITAEENAAAYLQEELTANEQMEKKQYVQKVHVLSLKRGIEEYQARRGEHLADIAEARQKITDLELKIIDLKNAYLQEAADKLTAAQATIYDLEERFRPAMDASTRQKVLAPITGVVVNLRFFTVDGVVGPREPILDIVPEDNPLIVESKVNVEDIDDLRLQQSADIRLSAYKARSTPLIAGHVTYISADRLMDEATNVPYYLVHVEVDLESLRAAGDLNLYPGMPAEVFIQTDKRTALDYLLAPVTQTLRRSMRES